MKDACIYPVVKSQMALRGVDNRQMAEVLQLSYSGFLKKMCGKNPFLLEEAKAMAVYLGVPGEKFAYFWKRRRLRRAEPGRHVFGGAPWRGRSPQEHPRGRERRTRDAGGAKRGSGGGT